VRWVLKVCVVPRRKASAADPRLNTRHRDGDMFGKGQSKDNRLF